MENFGDKVAYIWSVAERPLRQVILGRGNWQFCGSVGGGRTAAALYSVVATCKHLGFDPWACRRQARPALFALGDQPGPTALAEWLPDVGRKRQTAPAGRVCDEE